MTVTDLLVKVHDRIGGGVELDSSVVVNALPSFTVRARWKRCYRKHPTSFVEAVWSDWREAHAHTIEDVLLAVLAKEDEMDRRLREVLNH